MSTLLSSIPDRALNIVRWFDVHRRVARLRDASSAVPCLVCFSALDPSARDSVNAGITVLLAVTCAVLLGFGVFIGRIALRSRASRRGGADAPAEQTFPATSGNT